MIEWCRSAVGDQVGAGGAAVHEVRATLALLGGGCRRRATDSLNRDIRPAWRGRYGEIARVAHAGGYPDRLEHRLGSRIGPARQTLMNCIGRRRSCVAGTGLIMDG
ncbi:hypothetical protein [Streptacidiphilus carbonis]|uniref:hypothetical protein n=1 Tax=Streptacidiphilus carbonis TaxID=105422 RepID=UPI001269F591|nr:hypothetical protein [Streptacidiphilus carbonis]